ncbi:IclR family transcriptional regulator C-terminal domain-containing protein [Streptomyces sp. ODS28]|uniref:IclR family transcriptional regulator domain-containing protein n=1 Tax=Streptomyces sp. ODS28 TaxID=3136688 RepID=UPI0031E86C97
MTESGVPVRPLERGLAVLRALARQPREQGGARAGDLARATGLARSTVDRIIATLDLLGYVRFDGRTAEPATPLMELGNAYLSASGLPDALAARAGRLADRLDESVSLAVPDGDGVRFIAQSTRRRSMALAFRIGDALPAERCAPGALFASGWDGERWDAWRARHEADPYDLGFPAVPRRAEPECEKEFKRRAERAGEAGAALDDQLIEPGLVAVAVPVRGPGGGTSCALSAVSHTSRHTARSLADAVLPELREAASGMARSLEAGPQLPYAAPQLAARPPVEGKAELGSGYLQSLARGLAVLRALGAAHGPGLPLSALAEATGVPRATARRSLLTLCHLGYAASDGGLFRPLPRVLELCYSRLTGLSLSGIVRPHLAELVGRVRESASVTVLEGTDIRYVARVAASRIMSADIAVGTRFPAYPTAMGRVLLAGLDADRRGPALDGARPLTRHTVTSRAELERRVEGAAWDGYAAVDQELEEGLRSVAVPLRDPEGRVVAALNVAQHAGEQPLDATRDALLPELRATAAAIEADLRTAGRHQRVRVP